MLKRLHLFKIVASFAYFHEICSDFESDFLENAEKRCNFSKFLDFDFDLLSNFQIDLIFR